MKVKNLIEKLKKLPGDSDFYFYLYKDINGNVSDKFFKFCDAENFDHSSCSIIHIDEMTQDDRFSQKEDPKYLTKHYLEKSLTELCSNWLKDS